MAKRLKARTGGGKLANALLRHQEMEKKVKKSKPTHNGHQLEQKRESKQIRKNREIQKSQQKSFVPFEKDDYVLLVGEGDMSFALSILNQGYVKPTRLIVTSYDNSPSELKLKYPHTFEQNYEQLIQVHKAKVFFKVDATKLLSSLKLTPKTLFKVFGIPKLDAIMFNFPHTGRGIKDQDRNIRDHQMLVLGYMKSSTELFDLFNRVSPTLNTTGLNVVSSSTESQVRIVLTVFEGEPYDSWNIKSLSKTLGLKVARSGEFQWEDFPEYHHRRTNSEQDTTKKAHERKARIYIFEKFVKGVDSAKKKRRHDESEPDSD